MYTVKRCTKCKSIQPLSNFHKQAKRKDGHREHCKTCRREERRLAHLKKDQQQHNLESIKSRSKKNGIIFNLTYDDINPPKICPILGITLEHSRGKMKYNSPSVDRIDPTKGYTKDNIQIISNLANVMKSNATPEQLVAFAKWALRTYGDNNEDTSS